MCGLLNSVHDLVNKGLGMREHTLELSATQLLHVELVRSNGTDAPLNGFGMDARIVLFQPREDNLGRDERCNVYLHGQMSQNLFALFKNKENRTKQLVFDVQL